MSAARPSSLLPQVLALGVAQTIAWASSTYLLAIIATSIARELGVSRAIVFGAFSVSLVVMALVGPAVGRAIDRDRGRGVLVLSNLVLAAGLALLGAATDLATIYAAWCLLGLGMGLGLYDAAFAALVRLHGKAARDPITGITLIAGFASTVGWPLTAFLDVHYGWRASCFVWAFLHLILALPLNLYSLRPGAFVAAGAANGGGAASVAESAPLEPGEARRAFVLLAIFFALTAFVTSALAAHLPNLLLAAGAAPALALLASTLLGPAQVAARIAEFFAAKRFRYHPLISARIATALHPLGALGVVGGVAVGGLPAAAASLALLHGAGNGMITIAKGTLPLAVFGPAGYGQRQGQLAILARAMQALAPFAFGVVLDGLGFRQALLLSTVLSLVALAALLALRPGHRD